MASSKPINSKRRETLKVDLREERDERVRNLSVDEKELVSQK